MHSTSALYQQLRKTPGAVEEKKLEIAGVEYSQSEIISGRVSGGSFSKFSIGNCASRQADFEIFPKGNIPKAAEIKVLLRYKYGDRVSEWVPKGVFFISTRQKNKITGAYSFTAFDAMLKAEDTWLDASHAPVNWPMPASDAVADIAKKMGVEVDPRTSLTTSFPVEFPVGEEGDYSMREVLSYIAVSNAGNWVITDEGKLRLLRRGELPVETFYLVDESGGAILFGEGRLLV